MTPGSEIFVASGVLKQIVRSIPPKTRTVMIFQVGTAEGDMI